MEQGKDYFLSQTPLKRFGSEADLKGAAVFLLLQRLITLPAIF